MDEQQPQRKEEETQNAEERNPASETEGDNSTTSAEAEQTEEGGNEENEEAGDDRFNIWNIIFRIFENEEDVNLEDYPAAMHNTIKSMLLYRESINRRKKMDEEEEKRVYTNSFSMVLPSYTYYAQRSNCAHSQLRNAWHPSSVPHRFYFRQEHSLNCMDLQQNKSWTILPARCLCSGAAFGYYAGGESPKIHFIDDSSQKVFLTVNPEPQNQLNAIVFFKRFGTEEIGVVTCRNDSALQIWKFPQMEELQNLHSSDDTPQNYNYASVSPDGRHLITVMDHSRAVYYWTLDTTTGLYSNKKEIPIFSHPQSAMICDWHPYSNMFAVGAGQCAVYDLDKRRVVATFDSCNTERLKSEEAEEENWGDDIRLVRFCPNASIPLLAFMETNKRMHLVNTKTWECQIIKFQEDSTGLFFSPDGHILYIGTTAGLYKFDVVRLPTLKDICVQYIRKLEPEWEKRGWEMHKLPFEVRELLTQNHLFQISPEQASEMIQIEQEAAAEPEIDISLG